MVFRCTRTPFFAAREHRFSLHANTAVGPKAREALERLCRYIARPAAPAGRISRMPDGRILMKLKSRWGDGTTAKLFQPRDLLSKLVALVPRPRVNLLRYHGVFAANANWRSQVVPGLPRPRRPGTGKCTKDAGCSANSGKVDAATAAAREERHELRMSWAQAMARAFKIDVLECACGGRRELLALIPAGETASKILAHLKLPSKPPAFARARPPPTAFARLDWYA